MPEQDKLSEKDWYGKGNPWVKWDHFLMKWPFFYLPRHKYAYRFARENARRIILEHIKTPLQKGLVAPSGINGDQDILCGTAEEYLGIDISPEAVKRSSRFIKCQEADILKNGFEDSSFDIVASFLFFHHLHKTGFKPFLKEFRRILKKDGYLLILDPSAHYPVSKLMDLGRKIFGNISGLVPDEAPVVTDKLAAEIRGAGFKIERFQALTYSHNRIPIPIQYLINKTTAPFQKIAPFNKMGWLCLWICSKDLLEPVDKPF
ncbi:MAG: methyltransferase domain-containing protein [Candidatus Margulisiibacteriota bacterium]